MTVEWGDQKKAWRWWAIIAGLVACAAVAAPAIWMLFGPQVGYARGPRYSFLTGHAPVRTDPSVNGGSACDVYSFPSTVAVEKERIDASMGSYFEDHSVDREGFDWSSAKDNSGIEIRIFPRREWNDAQGQSHQEDRADWVSVYVFYPTSPRPRPGAVQFSLVGRWKPVVEGKPWETITEYRADGSLVSVVTFKDRHRKQVITGKWSTEAGWLITQGLRTETTTDSGTKVDETPAPVDRQAIIWLDADTFEDAAVHVRSVRVP